jgi:chromosome segregation ATPase
MATQSAEAATSTSVVIELRNIAAEIAKVQADLGKVGGELDKVQERVEALQTALQTGDISMLQEQSLEAVATEVARLQKKEEQLRESERLLRESERLLREEKRLLREEELLLLKRQDRLETNMPSGRSWLWPENACMVSGRYVSLQTVTHADSKEDIHI